MATWTQLDGKNRWRIRIDLGTDAAGKRIRRSLTYEAKATTPRRLQQELQRAADDFYQQCMDEMSSPYERISVRELIEKWQASRDVTDGEIEFSDSVFLRFLPDLLDKTVSDLTVSDVQTIIDDMSETVAASSVRRYFTPVRSLLQYAYRLEFMPYPLVDRVSLPRSSHTTRKNFWTTDQLKIFLSCLEVPHYSRGKRVGGGLTWQTFFTLAVYTGARRGELIALRWSSISRDMHTIVITAAVAHSRSGQYVKDPKTSAGVRSIILPDGVFELLDLYRDSQSARNFSVASDAFLFQQENGKPLHLSTPTHKFQKLITIFNRDLPPDKQLPEITLHGLRHSAASLMIASGVDVLTVARRLGHSKASVTLDIYSHADEAKDVDAAEVFASLLMSDKSE